MKIDMVVVLPLVDLPSYIYTYVYTQSFNIIPYEFHELFYLHDSFRCVGSG